MDFGEQQTMTCGACGAEVGPPDGGVCVLCLQPYCASHLAPQQGDVGPLCKTCGGGR